MKLTVVIAVLLVPGLLTAEIQRGGGRAYGGGARAGGGARTSGGAARTSGSFFREPQRVADKHSQ